MERKRINDIFNSKAYFIVPTVFLFIFFCWYGVEKNDSEYNVYKCETKNIALKGIIDALNEKTGYAQVHIKGSNKWISLNISETIESKGFSYNYSYAVGDSIIKKANSKEFIIKRNKNFAKYILDCKDE